MSEKRQHKRLKRRLSVKFGDKSLEHTAYTMDVSQGGMFLVTGKLMPVNARIHIQLFTDTTEFVLLEGEVRRQRVIPPQLRSVERGGFGVRFMHPGEVVRDVLRAERLPRYSIAFGTPAAFQLAFEAELAHGGAFVPTNQLLATGTKVLLEVQLPFAAHNLELDAQVVHVSEPGGTTPTGLGLLFADPNAVTALHGFLPR